MNSQPQTDKEIGDKHINPAQFRSKVGPHAKKVRELEANANTKIE